MLLVEFLCALALYSAFLTSAAQFDRGHSRRVQALGDLLEMRCGVNSIWFRVLRPNALKELGVTWRALERAGTLRCRIPPSHYQKCVRCPLKSVDLILRERGQSGLAKRPRRLLCAHLTLASEFQRFKSEQWLIATPILAKLGEQEGQGP